ncbi:MAG: hypothetical protein ACYS0K_16440, partial [Planctomycetota bacterium]
MTQEDPKQGGGDGSRLRRIRNLPLIVLLSGLALVALLQIDPQAGQTARITYAQFRQLGEQKALADIEILHSIDHVEIQGKLDKTRVKELIDTNTLTDEERKQLDERERYRVDGVMRGVVDDPQ